QAGAAVPVLCWGEGQLVAGDAGCAMSSVRRSDDLEDGRYRRVNVGRGQGGLASSVLGGGEGLRLSNGCVVDRCDGHGNGGGVGVELSIASSVGEAGGAVPVGLWSEGHLVAADEYGAMGRIRGSYYAVGQRVSINVSAQ